MIESRAIAEPPEVPRSGRLRRIATYIAAFVSLAFFTARILANHLPTANEIRRFAASDQGLRAITGSITSSDITIHSLVDGSLEGTRSIHASGSASGPDGEAQLIIVGQETGASEEMQFRMVSARPARCYLTLFCVMNR